MYIVFIFICINSNIIFAITVQHINCPHLSHWNKRSTDICNITSGYHCLYDENDYSYVEFCREKPYFESPGFKVVVLGDLNGRMCDHSRFQPFIFWTNGSSKCAFSKSTCSEEGQVIISNGTTIKDRSCRCDYRRGYTFVTERSNLCSCVPSEEDCTCYSKLCPVDHELNQDYECTPVGSYRNNTRCKEISEPWRKETTTVNTDLTNKNGTEFINCRMMAGFVLTLILIVGVLSITAGFVFLFTISPYGFIRKLKCLDKATTANKTETGSENIEEETSKKGEIKCHLNDIGEPTQGEEANKLEKEIKYVNADDTSVKEPDVQVSGPSAKVQKVLVHQATVNVFTDQEILKLCEDQKHYLRIVHLVTYVAASAVRKLFDELFEPVCLQRILEKERDLILDKLRKRNVITRSQWNVLFPPSGNVTSKSFDITLMICLINNLTKVVLRQDHTSIISNLTKLKSYRGELFHSPNATLGEKEFHEYWDDISKIIIEVGGETFKDECIRLKEPWTTVGKDVQQFEKDEKDVR